MSDVDATWIVLLALAFGFSLGALVVHLGGVAASRGQRALQLASEAIPDGIADVVGALESAGVVVDASNTVLRASPAAIALGLVADRGLANAELAELVQAARTSGQAEERMVELRRSRFDDAQLRHLSARAAPIGARFILLLADDRTDEIRLEGVRRDFVANVSHELKTPIGAVTLLADAIDAAADEPERVRAFANRLMVEAARLGALTQELIDLSRVQDDDPLDDPERVQVDAVVDRAIDAVRVAAEAKRIRISTRVVDAATVLGDESMLVMALHNLVANAVQYSPEGSHVGVGARLNGDLVEVSVTDKGVGIAPADADRVFERFYRVDPARSRVTGGTGLGLSITKHIAVSHGGEVQLWSKPGQGSTFTLRLPVAQPEAQGAA
ncbi:ATP-binding protein [Agrococcus versicolor]|uniref:Sensor-like histidine kinase SenX3 n=1 Tax=Agrococcus versicolor TaxID=501482 RepID=A0ABN3ARV1_9MICO